MEYDDDGRLWKTSGSNETTSVRQYDDAGWIARYEENTSQYQATHTIKCDANGDQTWDTEYHSGDHTQASRITLNASGNPVTRKTDFYRDNLWMMLEYRYQQFVQASLALVAGTTEDEAGTSDVTLARQYYDGNRYASGQDGLENEQVRGDSNAEFVLYQTDHDGVSLAKWHIPQGEGFESESTSLACSTEQIFIGPSGLIFAMYTLPQDPRSKEPTVVDFLSHTHSTPQGGMRSLPDGLQVRREFARTASSSHLVLSVLDATQAYVAHPTPITESDYSAYYHKGDGYEDYQPAPISSYPSALPGHYTVPQSGLTLPQVSKIITGSERYAGLLAQANGYPVTHRCLRGEVVQVPQLQFNYSQPLDQVAYQRVMQAFMSNLSPHLDWCQHHASFFEKIGHILIQVISVGVGALLVVFTGAGGVAALLEGGLFSAAADAGLQEVAVGTGLLSQFSWSDVFQAAVGGISAELVPLMGGSVLDNIVGSMVVQGSLNLVEQLAEMAVGERSELNFRELLSTMVVASLDAGIELRLASSNDIYQQQLRLSSMTMLNSIVGSAIMGEALSLQQLALNQFHSELSAFASEEVAKIKLTQIGYSHSTTPAPKPAQQQQCRIPQLEEVNPNVYPDNHYAVGVAAGQGQSHAQACYYGDPDPAALPDHHIHYHTSVARVGPI